MVVVLVVIAAGRRRGFLGPREPHFSQLSGEYFHHAIRIRVIVYGRTVALAPAQHHQVELAVARVHQVPRVPEFVELGVFEPLGRVAPVRLHQVLHVLYVDAVLGEHPVQLVDQVRQPELAVTATAPASHRAVHVDRHVPVPAIVLYVPDRRTIVLCVLLLLLLLLSRQHPAARPLRRPRELLLLARLVARRRHQLSSLYGAWLTDAFHVDDEMYAVSPVKDDADLRALFTYRKSHIIIYFKLLGTVSI